MCPKPNQTNHNTLSKTSHVEDFMEPIPELFQALMGSEPDAQERWITVTFPIDVDLNNAHYKPNFEKEIKYRTRKLICQSSSPLNIFGFSESIPDSMFTLQSTLSKKSFPRKMSQLLTAQLLIWVSVCHGISVKKPANQQVPQVIDGSMMDAANVWELHVSTMELMRAGRINFAFHPSLFFANFHQYLSTIQSCSICTIHLGVWDAHWINILLSLKRILIAWFMTMKITKITMNQLLPL